MRGKKRFRINWLLWGLIILIIIILISLPKGMSNFYPQPHQELILKWAQVYGVDSNLVFAIIRAESKYETRAESSKGAKGLMQIMPTTGQWIADQLGVDNFDVNSLHDPDQNIQFGCWYLADLSKEFHGSLPLVITAYNAGRGTVRQWNENGIWDGDLDKADQIPYKETRFYLKAVWKNYQAYQAIYKSR